MDRGTVARIEDDWDRRAVGGRAGLAKLGDSEFSGAVTDGGAWLFMLNGRVVGTVGGTVDAIAESDDLTAHTAPHPSLPLLFAMQERGGETQAKYFTDDTPLSEVHDTLSSGSFTGYVELSENVHSGDYYVVYYGGRPLYAAFVGNAERLVTGEEAFERAVEEVGIYEVRSVELDVQEVPDAPADSDSVDATPGVATADASDEASEDPQPVGTESPDVTDSGTEPTAPDDETAVDHAGHDGERVGDHSDLTTEYGGSNTGESESEPAAAVETNDQTTSGEASAETAPEAADAEEQTESTSPDPTESDTSEEDHDVTPEDDQNPQPATEERAAESPGDASAETVDSDRSDSRDPDPADGRSSTTSGASPTADPATAEDADTEGPSDRAIDAPGGDAGATPEEDSRFNDEAAWREERTVPALDPERTSVPATGSNEESETDETTMASESPAPRTDQSSTPDAETRSGATDDRTPGTDQETAPDRGAATDRVAELENRVSELRDRVSELSEERDELRTERDGLAAEREELSRTVEELTEERNRLQARIEELEGGAGETESGSRDFTPDEALSQTDLFVRYGSKSEATLGDVRDGDATREAVSANLQLETHTRFEADGVTVDGEPFESFLEGTLRYRFVTWVVEELLFEIRETGNQGGLRDLYDALPEIDRAEFDGTVSMRDGEGEEQRVAFDIVLRNRMGQPLIVADLDTDRDPTSGSMMDGLLERATTTVEAQDTLAATFLVTASFFRNEVHESVQEATKTGFLDRDSRVSFVKAARNGGYHVCLIEARGEKFHVTRPDL